MKLEFELPSYAFSLDRKNTKKVFAAAGREIAQQARRLIGKAGSVSKPGQPPNSRTGQLKKSLKVKPLRRGLGVTVRDTVPWAKWLETGARGGGKRGVSVKNKRRGENTKRYMAPRPYLSRALEMRKASIEKRIKEAVLKGLAFEKQKVR